MDLGTLENKMNDLLFVSFEEGNSRDQSGICVSRRNSKGDIFVLKMELGEQADILHTLLTDQSAKAEIK